MSLDLRHLRLVATVAETGGVTRAAQRLHLTQSALSHQLRDVESRLGVPLFVRAGRRMVLTPAGERVREAAHRVLGELERAEADVTAARDEGPTGLLRVATECYTCYHWLPPVLASWRARWPRVELRIVGEATRRPLPALARGELDVAVVSRPLGAPAAADRRFAYEPLFDDELALVVAPSHRFAGRVHVAAGELAGEHLVLYNMPDEQSTLLHDVLRPAGVRPRSVTRVELTEAIVELVKAGLGVGMLARWAVAPQLASGALAAVRVGPEGVGRQWSAVTRSRGARPPYVDDFIASVARDAFPARPI